jgi:hypothetical protein
VNTQAESVQGDDECPINLRYIEPLPDRIDVDDIVLAGRRLRHKRRVTALAGSAAIVAIAVSGALGLSQRLHDGSGGATLEALAQRPEFQAFPPVDHISTLGSYADASPAGWSAVAWLSRTGDLCYGAADLRGRSAEPAVSCGTAPNELLASGPDALISKPIFQPAPTRPGSILAIGFVRGTASRVSVTDLGTTTTASVVSLSTGNGQHVGAYAIWLPVAANHGAAWSDITKVEALSDDGTVLADLQ